MESQDQKLKKLTLVSQHQMKRKLSIKIKENCPKSTTNLMEEDYMSKCLSKSTRFHLKQLSNLSLKIAMG